MIDIEWWLTILRFLLESSGAFHSTKTSENLETVANGTEISRENFQKVRELLNFWDANHSTESPENSVSKVECKESFSKIWVYHARLSGFAEISKNTVPFDTRSCRNFKKPEVLVEWKVPAIFRKIPNDDVMSDISLSISNICLCRFRLIHRPDPYPIAKAFQGSANGKHIIVFLFQRRWFKRKGQLDSSGKTST